MSIYHSVITPMTTWLHANPHWSGLITFLVSFSESLAIVGTIVPGSITMAAIGVLVGSGVIPVLSTFIYAVLGAVLGDNASYYLGYYFRDRIVDYWPFSRYPSLLDQGKQYFSHHGGKSVFLGRFFGPLRAIIPLIAGMMQMSNLRFFIANVSSGFLWSLLYLMPGVLLGAAAQFFTPEVATRYLLSTLAISLLIYMTYKLTKYIAAHTSKKTQLLLETLWHWLHRHPKLQCIAKIIAEGDKPLSITQLSLLLSSFTLFILFVSLSQLVIHHEVSALNHGLAYFLQGLRTPALDIIVAFVSASANKLVVIPAILTLSLVLYWKNLKREALILLSLMLSTALCVGLVKHFIFIARPSFIAVVKSSSSYPSGHTALAFMASFFLTLLYQKNQSSLGVRYLFAPAAAYTLLVALSRLYLGDHWLTDVMAGILLSSAIFFLHAILIRQRVTERDRLPSIQYIFLSWLLITTIFSAITLKTTLNRTQANQYPQQLSYSNWKTHGDNRPIRLWRHNRLGQKMQFLNIQTNLAIGELKDKLLAHGWKIKPEAHISHYLDYYLNPNTHHFQPLLRPLYLNHRADLSLIKPSNDKPVILQLWKTKTTLVESLQPIVVGALYQVKVQSDNNLLRHFHHASFHALSKNYLGLNKQKIKTLTIDKEKLYLLIGSAD